MKEPSERNYIEFSAPWFWPVRRSLSCAAGLDGINGETLALHREPRTYASVCFHLTESIDRDRSRQTKPPLGKNGVLVAP
jgi:hypothetical protein